MERKFTHEFICIKCSLGLSLHHVKVDINNISHGGVSSDNAIYTSMT